MMTETIKLPPTMLVSCLVLGILLVLELNCYLGKKNVNLETFSCHMLNPPAESECHV